MTPLPASGAAKAAPAKKAAKKAAPPTTGDDGDDGNDGVGNGPTPPERGARGFIAAILSGWQAYITTVGTIAAAVAGYQLAKDLGMGDEALDGVDHVAVLGSILAFGIGIALLLSIPVILRSNNRATLAGAVRLQTARKKWWHVWDKKKPVIGREVLYGHPTVIEFEEAMVVALNEARGYWEDSLEVPIGVDQRIENYIVQREEAQLHVVADQVRRSSRYAIYLAVTGLALGIGGYGNATYITNQGQRRATVNDEAAKRDAERQKQVLTAQLATATPLLPATPSDVKVVFPTKDDAAAALGVPVATLDEACWKNGRVGEAYDLSASASDDDRIVLVLLDATSTRCPAAVSRVSPSWLKSPKIDVPDVEASTSTTAKPSAGG